MKAYENLIPDGVTPSYFLYLDIDPQAVDVNIHPTKTEIKFEDDSVIFQIVYACIKEALGKNSFGDTIDFDREGLPEIPTLGKNYDEFRDVSVLPTNVDPTFNPFDTDGLPSEQSPYTNSFGGMNFPSDGPASFGTADSYGTQYSQPSYPSQQTFASMDSSWEDSQKSFNAAAVHAVERRDDYGKLFEDKLAPTKSILTIQGKYIITTGRSGLLVVNIQRAMERIMYDRFLAALSKNEHLTQNALFPVSVYVGVENMCLFEEHSQMLAALGFDIAPFGTDTVVVNGVPEGYSAEAGKVQTMIGDLLLVLSEDCSALPEMMMANMASRLARLGAFSGDSVKNPAEAQALIDTLFQCENPEYTSAGKKVVSIIPVDEIDKRF